MPQETPSTQSVPNTLDHTPVLLDETVALLAPAIAQHPAPLILDCTAGRGGHAAALARTPAHPPTVVLFDLDPQNLNAAHQTVQDARPDAAIVAHHANFAEAPRRLAAAKLHAHAVLADLGFASTQMNNPARGFAFRAQGPLDMRYDDRAHTTAAHIVNTAPENELAQLLRDLGEEPHARRIARAITIARQSTPIQTTTQLADLIRHNIPTHARKPNHKPNKMTIHPATRTFQALRIAVNDELAALDALLEATARAALATPSNPDASFLAPAARIAVIAFHSLEDRRVKTACKALAERSLATTLTRKPITPSDAETQRNPRARSAKLRAVQLLP